MAIPHIGGPELIIVLVIVIILFGVGRIGKLGKEMGSAISSFRKGIQGEGDIDERKDSK